MNLLHHGLEHRLLNDDFRRFHFRDFELKFNLPALSVVFQDIGNGIRQRQNSLPVVEDRVRPADALELLNDGGQRNTRTQGQRNHPANRFGLGTEAICRMISNGPYSSSLTVTYKL